MSTRTLSLVTVRDGESESTTTSLVEALGQGADYPSVQPTLRNTSTFSKKAVTFSEERTYTLPGKLSLSSDGVVSWSASVDFIEKIEFIARFNLGFSYSPNTGNSQWIQDILKETFSGTQDDVCKGRQKEGLVSMVWREMSHDAQSSDAQIACRAFTQTEAPNFIDLPFHEDGMAGSGGEPNLEMAEEMREVFPEEAEKGWTYAKRFNGARRITSTLQLSKIETNTSA
jgi:hypothetical protein